ncbi:MAG: hypothetical protein ACC662_03855, partial [Planctomycetota bacterium]
RGGRGGGTFGGGFGAGRGGTSRTNKDWQILREQEDRRKRIEERRRELMDASRRAQQEAREDALRLDAAQGA